MTEGALAGIRVIDWTHYHQGAAGAMLLAELGADVIHVEPPGRGDLMRGLASMFGVPLALPGGRHALFEDLNKNKRSICLDLARPAGREIMYRLVEQADVFVTNMRPQAVHKLGMEYPALAERAPRLIYGEASAFGDRGPERESPGLELMAYARSGGMLASGEAGWPPVYLAPGIGDRIGGIFLAFGVLAALVVRERTGIGQYFSTSQLGGMIHLQSAAVLATLLTGQNVRATPRERANNPLFNWYLCRDGRWIALGILIDVQRHWPVFCRAIGRPELIEDSRFADTAARARHGAELVAILDDLFAEQPCDEWERRLRAGGDLTFTPMNSLADLAADPQIRANGYLIEFNHPTLGPTPATPLPIAFSATPTATPTAAPACGQHTEEILIELLGLTWEEIASLREQAVI
ncbi:MAG: CoA transferase [Dehalococcoidia bacterium]